MNKNKFYEAFAALILVKADVIKESFNNSWLKDRPDLQIGDLGIEVTEAISTKQGEQRFFQQEILDCKTVDDANKLPITTTPKNRNRVIQIENTPYFFVSTGLEKADEKETSNLIVSRIRMKNKMFKDYPDLLRFRERWVFVFVEDVFSALFPVDFQCIKAEIGNSDFDGAFVMLNHDLLIIKNGVDKEVVCSLNERDFLELSVEASRIIGASDIKKKEEFLEKYKKMKKDNSN